MIKKIVKKILRWNKLKVFWLYREDVRRLVSYSGAYAPHSKSALETNIIVRYHVLEKGLTMPDRHLPFGMRVAAALIDLVDEYERHFEIGSQVRHAISVLKEYLDVHEKHGIIVRDDAFWKKVSAFIDEHAESAMSEQLHFSRKDFYAAKSELFPQFAKSRHSVRNYSPLPVDMEKIRNAVHLATLSPSACNRQHIFVRCLSDKNLCGEVLTLQGGNRGFGHLADKVLLITSDMCAEIGGFRERNDAYVNGGIFLMNLSYALHYYEVAHCILTCSFEADVEKKMRKICKISDNEVFIAMMSCGEAPEEFDVALSPRRELAEVFSVVEK